VSILGETWVDAARQVVVVAAIAHLAFQWVVHVVVYPGLADQAASVAGSAAALHARYTSRMAVVVAPVYGLLVISSAAAFAGSPDGWSVVTVAVVAAVVGLTAGRAVPIHRALSVPAPPARVAALHRQLIRLDRVRLVLAVALVACTLLALR